MIFKVQKPLVGNNYLIYNKDRSIVNTFLKIGEDREFDKLFDNFKENKIYIKGYMDKKGRLILNRRVEGQEW